MHDVFDGVVINLNKCKWKGKESSERRWEGGRDGGWGRNVMLLEQFDEFNDTRKLSQETGEPSKDKY